MPAPRVGVADVLELYGSGFLAQYGQRLSANAQKVLEGILRCGTGALGTHTKACTDCGHQELGANACRNRHCPKCLGGAAAVWLQKRADELLNTPYLHITFTLPAQFNQLYLSNKKTIGDIFLLAVKETLLQVGATEKFLGAKIGFLSVFHSWGSAMNLHLHIHNLVTAGGLTEGGNWKTLKNESYFAPTKVLAELFRGKFIAHLKRAYTQNKLALPTELASPSAFEAYLNTACKHKWIVDCQPPVSNPLNVLKYLARYVTRIAISNSRIVSINNGQIRFWYKDYRTGQQKIISLAATEFLRRFTMHILPKQFTRIRHYGFLSPSTKKQALSTIREIIGSPVLPEEFTLEEQEQQLPLAETCPSCKTGRMKTIAFCMPALYPSFLTTIARQPAYCDSS